MSYKQNIELVSMYLHQPVLGARGIALELEPISPDHLKGKARLDPNTCTVDLWGDRGICTKMAFQDYEVEATRLGTVDPQGFRRVHWSLRFEGMMDAKVNLIEHPNAGVRYLTVQEDGEAVTAIVPLFNSDDFVPTFKFEGKGEAEAQPGGGSQPGGENE